MIPCPYCGGIPSNDPNRVENISVASGTVTASAQCACRLCTFHLRLEGRRPVLNLVRVVLQEPRGRDDDRWQSLTLIVAGSDPPSVHHDHWNNEGLIHVTSTPVSASDVPFIIQDFMASVAVRAVLGS